MNEAAVAVRSSYVILHAGPGARGWSGLLELWVVVKTIGESVAVLGFNQCSLALICGLWFLGLYPRFGRSQKIYRQRIWVKSFQSGDHALRVKACTGKTGVSVFISKQRIYLLWPERVIPFRDNSIQINECDMFRGRDLCCPLAVVF